MSQPKPNPPRKVRPVQPSLFDDPPPAAAAKPAQSLVAIPTPAATQRKTQQAFNRLVGQIQQQRESLAQWQQYELRYHQRLATELQPAQARQREAQRTLVTVLDGLLGDSTAKPRLKKAERRKLVALIQQIADQVLQEAPDAEIEAIFNRHGDVTHADLRQAELAEAQAIFGHLVGEDPTEGDGHQAQSIDELMQQAAERLAAQAHAQQAAQAQQAPRGRQAEAARQRQEDAAKQASQSVREVFRKLASLLHPDRETDAVERARKTELMQQANQAYQADDLLTLLTLQLQTEQIDSLHLAGLPDARLNHYNQVLREQLAALQQKLGECTAHFRIGLGLKQRELTPAVVDNALARDIQELCHFTRLIELDIAQLRDPATRQMAIANIELLDDDDDEPDAFEAMLLMEAFASAPAFRPPRKKGRR
jgi:hypothetical protein